MCGVTTNACLAIYSNTFDSADRLMFQPNHEKFSSKSHWSVGYFVELLSQNHPS
jgi:hypothetical protein